MVGREIKQWYQQKHKDCNVWLALDEQEAKNIARQYYCLMIIKSNEPKLSHRGKLYFFKEDDFYLLSDDDCCSSTYFELEWAPNPDGKKLKCPPAICETGREFRFNSNPDYTYWLTTRRMNSHYSEHIRRHTCVPPDADADADAAAPYLTIEFKKDNTTFEAAVNQVAVSASLILYNRFQLRLKRLRVTNREVNPRAFDDLKHYGIAFDESVAHLFVARPHLVSRLLSGSDNHWHGCQLEEFDQRDVRRWQNVITIQKWVNEIHDWGMSEWSSSFVLDLKAILREGPGGDRVSLSPEELTTLEFNMTDKSALNRC